MSKSLVLPFKLAEPESGFFILVTRPGVVRLSTRESYVALERLARKGWGSVLTDVQINDLLSEIPSRLRGEFSKYLEEIEVLRPVDDDFGRFSAIRLFHDEQVHGEILRSDLSYFTGIPCAIGFDPLSVRENEFVVALTPSHNTTLIVALQRAVDRLGNSPLQVAYLTGRSFIVDGLYIPRARTPCHFCQSSELLGLAYPTSERPSSWIRTVETMTVKPPIVGLEYRIMPSDYWYCSAVLRNRVREIVGPGRQPLCARTVLDRWEFSLDGFHVQREVPKALQECEFCNS